MLTAMTCPRKGRRAGEGSAGLLIGVNAGWMAFDGVRALVAGDHVTPRQGPRAGRLGPWASIVRAVGVDPRSTGCKTAIASYGVASLGLAACLVFDVPWSGVSVLSAASVGLLYLPMGTLLNGVAMVLWLGPRSSP